MSEPTELVECVPNISEGLDPAVVALIAGAAEGVPGASLLHTDRGEDANRTVLTLAGAPAPLEEAVFRVIERAAEIIDLRAHQGTHPRIGATDVVPFIPLAGVDMAHCVLMAERLGKRVAEQLGIPVFLYQRAARREERRELSAIRRGNFEGIAEKLQLPEWEPDFGSRSIHPTAGATVIGARDFLVAFNIHLESQSLPLVRSIARELRLRYPQVRAIGWDAPRYGLVQVSTNLMNFRITGLYEVYRTIAELAAASGVTVGGSEIIGMVPEVALAHAGASFEIPLATDITAVGYEDFVKSSAPREAHITAAIDRLGLSRFSTFKPDERILERRLKFSFGWSPDCV